MNMQNWPHALLKYLMVDEGFVGYALDLSQAENRIVAQVGNITTMINAFENGHDVHSMTASLIFGGTPEEIKHEDELKIKCSLGDGSHTKRFWGKKANHGFNYDLGFKNAALAFEIPERDGRFLVDRYHEAYPGVRKRFHKLVRRQLQTNRTVENLLGRKTLFLGPMDQQTYKEAYSCIPQGTVGDVINERGMSYVYYNQDLFGPIELLGQVHDEIIFQIPSPDHPTNPCSFDQHAQMLKLIKTSLETPLHVHGREFVIPVDTTVFKRFKQGRDLSSVDVSQSVETVSNLLRETWKLVEATTDYNDYNPAVPVRAA